MMKRKDIRNCLLCPALFTFLGGCGTLLGLVGPTSVTIILRNQADFSVSGSLFYHEQQDIPEVLLAELGEELSFTLAAGGSSTFVRSCDDVQAMIIDDADLNVIGSIGPEAGTDVLRDGDDFRCGDTVILTFDHSEAIVDFDIAVEVQ